ncbi:efflux transporter outer membrane subunit [Pseudoduganella albidiflava]|uniref:AdeC/adeK/oprM family multidrug efflux complex outer membrane factor n=1 Tax=Pseudoduganella albidiflava TaxID=321983 RepID=A0A411WUG0_9BURK|nr:efflux transporter outer membrane subunit [Pseudoduganella albidiflava]QBI00400.1 efflux transporter outer membrane subunit [Pseudoduganella albidiflava]GGY53636.1 adeC/adeK/oprM family multidrug efflux complex outer membrane factor [Pseudoduganella albidiflava]
MTKTLITLAVTALLAGCSLAPTYERPAAPVTPAWPQGDAYQPTAAAADAKGAYEVQWREFIADEQLEKLVELALANNRDLRVSILNIEAARAQYGVQRADRVPNVNASVGQTAQRVPANSSATGEAYISRQYSAGLGIPSFELDFFGRVKNLSEAALQQYLGTEEARRSQQISLVAEVANAWLTLAADLERLRLAQDTLKSQQISYELSKRRFEAGATSGLDMYEAQTSVETARSDVAVYTAQVAADQNALALLAGAPVPAELLPQGALQSVTQLAELPEGVPSEVLQRRPDVLAAERTLQANNANIGVARAAFFPSISLTASAGAASGDLSNLFKAGAGTWSFIPQLTLPIFAGGRNQANLDLARANRDIALAQYEKAIQSAFREVSDALAQRGTIDERVASQAALVEASGKSYRIHEQRYQKGAESYLNALVSQRNLYAAQQTYISARLAKASNQVTLYKVLGGGWQ